MRSNAAVVGMGLSALLLAGCGAGKQRISTKAQSYRACALVSRQVTATCAQTARLTQLLITCLPLAILARIK